MVTIKLTPFRMYKFVLIFLFLNFHTFLQAGSRTDNCDIKFKKHDIAIDYIEQKIQDSRTSYIKYEIEKNKIFLLYFGKQCNESGFLIIEEYSITPSRKNAIDNSEYWYFQKIENSTYKDAQQSSDLNEFINTRLTNKHEIQYEEIPNWLNTGKTHFSIFFLISLILSILLLIASFEDMRSTEGLKISKLITSFLMFLLVFFILACVVWFIFSFIVLWFTGF